MKQLASSGWKGILVLMGITVVFISITAWSPATSDGTPESLSELLFAPMDEDCSAECSTDGCFPNQHYYEIYGVHEGWVDEGFGSPHPCQTGSCGQHEECVDQREEEDMEDLELALSTLDGNDLRRLIDRNAERLLWNAERTSVQLLGCTDQVQMSISLNDHQIDALTEE